LLLDLRPQACPPPFSSPGMHPFLFPGSGIVSPPGRRSSLPLPPAGLFPDLPSRSSLGLHAAPLVWPAALGCPEGFSPSLLLVGLVSLQVLQSCAQGLRGGFAAPAGLKAL